MKLLCLHAFINIKVSIKKMIEVGVFLNGGKQKIYIPQSKTSRGENTIRWKYNNQRHYTMNDKVIINLSTRNFVIQTYVALRAQLS